MQQTRRQRALGTILGILFVVSLSGCSSMGLGHGANEAAAGTTSPMTYFPTKFHDFEAPTELSLDRDKTLIINTSSFTGGIIYMTGRLKVDSLTDFFIHSMQKNGWKLTGEAQYQNVLLSFTKPNKNCMITIYEGEFGTSTKVYAYMAEDLTDGGSGGGNGGNGGYGGGY